MSEYIDAYVELKMGDNLIEGDKLRYTKVRGSPWVFYHRHPIGDDVWNAYDIEKDECTKCGKKFPPHKSLVTAAELITFKEPDWRG